MMSGNTPRSDRLLPAVHDLALRLGADPAGKPSGVYLEQSGQMRRLGGKRWINFSAKQTISASHFDFDWNARMGPFGMISVRDAFVDGDGQLAVRALGFIPIVRADPSAALTRGELMRYLAELAWAPDAILHNTGLRWREDGPDILTVGAGQNDTAAEVTLNLDSQGKIAGVFAPDRPRSVTAPFLPTPWRGRFSDYRNHGGRWIPFAGEVAWEIDGKSQTYFQCKIERWAMPAD